MVWLFFPQINKELFLVRRDHTDFPVCLYCGSPSALLSASKGPAPGVGAKVNHLQAFNLF